MGHLPAKIAIEHCWDFKNIKKSDENGGELGQENRSGLGLEKKEIWTKMIGEREKRNWRRQEHQGGEKEARWCLENERKGNVGEERVYGW